MPRAFIIFSSHLTSLEYSISSSDCSPCLVGFMQSFGPFDSGTLGDNNILCKGRVDCQTTAFERINNVWHWEREGRLKKSTNCPAFLADRQIDCVLHDLRLSCTDFNWKIHSFRFIIPRMVTLSQGWITEEKPGMMGACERCHMFHPEACHLST